MSRDLFTKDINMVIVQFYFSLLKGAAFTCLLLVLLPVDSAIAQTTSEAELVDSPYLLAANQQLLQRRAYPTSAFADISQETLKEKSALCYRFPDAWYFVASTDSTLSDYTRLLAQKSGDTESEVESLLRKENPRIQLSHLSFFTYVRIPQKYKPLFRDTFRQKISQHNARSNCLDPTRPSRVYVAPSNMNVAQLLHSLGVRQKESKAVLANQIATLNQSVRPEAQIRKGQVILIPQNYPYSWLSANSDRQGGAADDIDGARSTFDSTGSGFFWSFGYFVQAPKVTGKDSVAGGSFDLVTDSGRSIELSLGYEIPADSGQLAFSTVVSQLKYSYQNSINNSITNTEDEYTNYLLRGYWQTSGSSFGYGSEIGKYRFIQLARLNQTETNIVGEELPFIAAFAQYKPSDTILSLSYGGLARLNMILPSEEYSSAVSIDFGVFVLWPISAHYDLSFDLGYREFNYTKENMQFLVTTVYSGISIQAF